MDWSQLPLARAATDRAAHRRTEPGLIDRAWADPATRVVLVDDHRLATVPDGTALVELRPADLGPLAGLGGDALVAYLGQDGPAAVLAVARSGATPAAADAPPVDPARPDAPPVDRALAHRVPAWTPLRDCGHLLDPRDAGLATAAVALAAWHARHPCCARCGAPTVPATAGWTRRCTVDDSEHYPRTDPAVIMAVTDDADRLLLAHAAAWPERRFSTLAGFVEPGESAEQAVAREVHEETSVAVTEVAYRGSQPWPFPASLMLAYRARALTTEVVVDGVEVTDARWFSRDELGSAVAAGRVLLPMRTSVARALIEEWFGGRLPDPPA